VQHRFDVDGNSNAAYNAPPKVDRRHDDAHRRKSHHLEIIIEERRLATVQWSTVVSSLRVPLQCTATLASRSSSRCDGALPRTPESLIVALSVVNEPMNEGRHTPRRLHGRHT
jgi:hypothetical protein